MQCQISLSSVLLLLIILGGAAFQFSPQQCQRHKLKMASISTKEEGALQKLCSISLDACKCMTPLITEIYKAIKTGGGNSGVKQKSDNSAFTIADGLVQRLLTDVLFDGVDFKAIVGEEDSTGDAKIEQSWTQVDGLSIPSHLLPLIESTKTSIASLSASLNDTKEYEKITIFIDPIDGTKEFSTGKGEQCSICIGFSNEVGQAVGGVVYRPLTTPPTWAVGAKSEGFADCYFGDEDKRADNGGGLLTSNGSISPFCDSLMNELGMNRIKSGGAGNKILLLLEKSIQLSDKDTPNTDTSSDSMLYIQDRGVSRWDTCAAEAVLEAFGGRILKLTGVATKTQERYTYLKSETNRDFIPNNARLTKYNSCLETIQPELLAMDASEVKPYSNLCGLVALGKEWNSKKGLMYITEAVQRASERNAPMYD